ncbi:MAG TPA: NDMA-dependent alcohol dehydrogenase [Acidimicrobiales bacterium]|nr:NDMA-dependent alcohol dehydrogenase [Acidimicrobiales bacterium]
MKSKAALAVEIGGPWVTEEIEIDEPRAHEVLVKTAFAGLCHSDEHARTGDMTAPVEVLRMLGAESMLPIIGGHEGSGVVEAVGEGVTGVAPGDHVASSFIPSCGKCHYCVTGRPYLCDMGAFTLVGPMISDGTWRHHWGDRPLNRYAQLGTFSEYMVVHEASLVRIDPWYDLRAAALISCGLATGFGSAATRGNVRPGDVVAVIGCGGVGSGAIQGAVHSGARAVVAIDTDPTKVDRAMKIGATHGAANALEAAFSFLPDLTTGRNCDVVILTPGLLTSNLIEEARSILGKGGVMVATGLGSFLQTSVDLNVAMFSLYNQELRGTVFGSEPPRVQIPKLLRLHHEGKFLVDELVTREYTIDEVNQGYLDLEAGDNVRGVVRF